MCEGYVVDPEFKVFAMLHYHKRMIAQLEVVRVHTLKNLLLVDELSISVHTSSATELA